MSKQREAKPILSFRVGGFTSRMLRELSREADISVPEAARRVLALSLASMEPFHFLEAVQTLADALPTDFDHAVSIAHCAIVQGKRMFGVEVPSVEQRLVWLAAFTQELGAAPPMGKQQIVKELLGHIMPRVAAQIAQAN